MAPSASRRIGEALLGEIRAWRRGPSSRVLGVDIDGNTLRVALVDGRGGKLRLLALKSASLRPVEVGPLSPEAKAILKIAGKEQVRVVIFIPRSRVTVRELNLPSHDPEELRRMAPFEAARLVPHSADELLVDFEILKRNEDGSSFVRLVIAQEAEIRATLSVLEEAGLEPHKIEISTTALSRLLHRAGERDGTICFLGDQRLDVLVLKNGEGEVSRGVELGRLVGGTEELARELTRSAKFVRRNEPEDSENLVQLVTTEERAVQVKAALNGSLRVDGYVLPRALLPKNFNEEPGPYLPAIGAALDTGEGINLLPRALRERRLRRTRVVQWVMAVSAGLLAVILMILLSDRYLASAAATLETRRNEIEELEPKVRHVSELQARSRAITEHLNPDFDALEIYTELYRVIPPEVTIYHMHLQLERGRLSLKGQTAAFPAVWKLLDGMAESKIFSDVRSRYAAKRQARGVEVIDFSLDADLSGGRR